MSENTRYYNLSKPSKNEPYNINIINSNSDIIDTTLQGLNTTVNNLNTNVS